MKGTVVKINDGWFVDTITVSDKPPFFTRNSIKIENVKGNKYYMREGIFVDFYIDIFATPVMTYMYAYITKELFI